jgi:hypothetical protein
MSRGKVATPQVTRNCYTDAPKKLSNFLDAGAQVLTRWIVGAQLSLSRFPEARVLWVGLRLCSRACLRPFVNNLVTLNMCPRKHDCEQTSIMLTFNRTY